MNMKIGQRLQTIREGRKMSQSEFADILSVSQSTYSRLERGETHVSIEELTRIAETLDIPIYELLPESTNFHQTNSDRGAGVIFGNYIVNMGNSEAIKSLEEENRSLAVKNGHLEEKIRLLEKQIEILEKKG